LIYLKNLKLHCLESEPPRTPFSTSRSSRRTAAAAPPAVRSPAWWASHLFAKAGCFLLLCAALLAGASFLSRGLVLCFWRAGKSPVLFVAVCCVPSASALGFGRGGAARGLEVRGPVLQPQVGGLGAGFAVEDRAQWRPGCDGPAWWGSTGRHLDDQGQWPPGLALGERP